jgi:cytochrome b pre-mRNA-processing protein 3
MLASLFRRLTAKPNGSVALFDALTAEARQPHWYVEGAVPDTIDGRFAVVGTLTALMMVRLEQAGDQGRVPAVALTERFVHVMETEHREIGLGDPALGKQVRRLVGSLANRVELWRKTIVDDLPWEKATEQSLYRAAIPNKPLVHSARSLKRFWNKASGKDVTELCEGRLE